MADESILDSVKKMIGIMSDDTTFDLDVITHINTIFMVLNQLGIGPSTGYYITDKNQLWSAFVAPSALLEGVKSYMVLRVKALFDPASTSFTQDSFDRQITEIEWRLVVQKETIHPPTLP